MEFETATTDTDTTCKWPHLNNQDNFSCWICGIKTKILRMRAQVTRPALESLASSIQNSRVEFTGLTWLSCDNVFDYLRQSWH
jgi:hypothetical protein